MAFKLAADDEEEENKEGAAEAGEESKNFMQLLNNNQDRPSDSFITTSPFPSIVPARTISLNQPSNIVDEPDMMENTQEFSIPLDDEEKNKIAAEIAELDQAALAA